MKHTKTIVALGVLVALLPFLGFPSSWKNIIFLILGASISAIAFRVYAENRVIEPGKEGSEFGSYQQSTGSVADMSVAHE